MKIVYTLLILFFTQCIWAQSTPSIKIVNSPTVFLANGTAVLMSGDGTAKLWVKDSITSFLQGRTVSGSSNPTLSFTVPASSYCTMDVSFQGNCNGAGTNATMKLSQGGNIIRWLPSMQRCDVAGSFKSGNGLSNLRLEAGSYTFDNYTTFDTNSGTAAYFGYCYTIR